MAVDPPPTSADAPSYEELAQEVASLRSLLAEQAKAIEKLSLENLELRARLGMNSRNSSKPPSSDGYEKPAPKSRRVGSGKQPGDPGHHLAQRVDPDETRIHPPDTCEKCGKDLFDAAVSGVIRRQVFDLPLVALFCTEHQAERRRCSCGTETTGTFPAEATAPACYGPALRAYVCYLVTRQHVPVAEQLRDTYGAPISTATIIAMVKEGAAMLEEFLPQVRDLLRDADVVQRRRDRPQGRGGLAWVHAVSTGDLTLYHLDKKRGTDGMDAMGVIEHCAASWSMTAGPPTAPMRTSRTNCATPTIYASSRRRGAPRGRVGPPTWPHCSATPGNVCSRPRALAGTR
jgi:transposase